MVRCQVLVSPDVLNRGKYILPYIEAIACSSMAERVAFLLPNLEPTSGRCYMPLNVRNGELALDPERRRSLSREVCSYPGFHITNL